MIHEELAFFKYFSSKIVLLKHFIYLLNLLHKKKKITNIICNFYNFMLKLADLKNIKKFI